jgi:hypothetical protein
MSQERDLFLFWSIKIIGGGSVHYSRRSLCYFGVLVLLVLVLVLLVLVMILLVQEFMLKPALQRIIQWLPKSLIMKRI